jgi:diguanylate cyclase (GGDEF)-like protein
MAGVEHNGIFTFGYRLNMDGKPLHVQLKAAMVEEKEGPRLVVGINDIDAQVRQEEEYGRRLAQAQTKANIDALTGIKNKHAFLEAEARLDHQIADKIQQPFAMVMLDMNDLKKINDTEGHNAGDQHIKNACKIICDVFKHSPVFRIGGDEFAVVLENDDFINRDALIHEFGEKQKEICASAKAEWDEVQVAIGIAVYDPDHDSSVNDTARRADKLMYANKVEGKRTN